MRAAARRIFAGLTAVFFALVLVPGVSAAAATRFPDVDYTDWYASGVGYCSRHGLITGYDDGRFGVGDTLTRAQLATILWRNADPTAASSYSSASTSNRTGMSDVASHDWYTGAANWAVSNGVINGYSNADGSRTFGPYDGVTLEQMVTILANYLDRESAEEASVAVLLTFTDGADVSSWARHQVAWGKSQGLVNGYENADGSRTLRPQEGVSRERAATILASACRNGVMDGGPKVDQTTVEEAQAAYDQAKEEYDEAQEAADEASTPKARSSVGFFEYLGDTQAEKVFQTSQVASGTGTDADGKTFGSYTTIGADGDATSLDNLAAAVDLMREGNRLRMSDNNFTGLSELRVTNVLMAVGEMNANWVAHSGADFGHPEWYGEDDWEFLSPYGYTSSGENLAGGYANPYDGWYTREKAFYDSGNQAMAGHYLNLTRSRFNVTGYGRAYGTSGVCDAQEFGYVGGTAYTVDQYGSLLAEYRTSLDHAQELATAKKAALDEATWTLEDAQAD